MNYEPIGVIATLIILIGFMSNGEKRIRIFDAVGAALFVLYGWLIRSFSVVLLNAVLIAVHVVKLRRNNGKTTEKHRPGEF